MASPIVTRLCLFLSVALTIGEVVARCGAQSLGRHNGSDSGMQVPRLCMPVSYRESFSAMPTRTRIAMLGDRHREVSEALVGWNETGVPLVGRFSGGWEPVPCGDDTGLFYMVPLIARQTGWNADQALDRFLLGWIAVSAAIGLSGLWLTVSGGWQRTLALVPIATGAYLSSKMGDVYVVQSSVVMMVLPWLVYVLKTGVKSWLRFLIVLLSGMNLGLAQWIRTQSASPVLVFFAVLICFSSLRRSIQILLSATLLLGMSLPLLYAQIPLRERDRFLAAHPTAYRAVLNRHLFWHAVYVGLGYLTNPYVTTLRDSAAVEYVQAIDPSVIYGGKEYEALLASRVGKIFQNNPRFVFYTLAAKAGVLACLLLLCINIGLAAAISYPKPIGTELAFWLAMALAAVPGILVIPVPSYVLGMMTLGLLYWYYSLSFYIERHSAVRPV